MRLFVAVEIAPAVAAAADALIDRLRARAVRLAPRSRITWVTADRLHLTVRFIGHVDADRADAVLQVLRRHSGRSRSTSPSRALGRFHQKGRLGSSGQA
jgi:2'-5' RNA ligase